MNKPDSSSIIYELHKLSAVVFPEKPEWTIEEIYNNVYKDSKKYNQGSMENLKNVLIELEKKGAIIFLDGYKLINLVEPQLLELVNVPSMKK